MSTAKRFEDLEFWQRAKELTNLIYSYSSDGLFARDFGLRDQMRRAAVSIPSNIAEGDERDTNRESVRYFYIAKGSLAELLTQVIIAQEVGYLTEDEFTFFHKQCDSIGKMLGNLIKIRENTGNRR